MPMCSERQYAPGECFTENVAPTQNIPIIKWRCKPEQVAQECSDFLKLQYKIRRDIYYDEYFSK
jgi:hypothetical protein